MINTIQMCRGKVKVAAAEKKGNCRLKEVGIHQLNFLGKKLAAPN